MASHSQSIYELHFLLRQPVYTPLTPVVSTNTSTVIEFCWFLKKTFLRFENSDMRVQIMIRYMNIIFRDGPDIRFSIRYPAKSGHFSAIRYPAGYRISKTGYPVSEYPAGYPANRILVWYFYSCLKIWDVSIIWVTLSNNEQALKYPVSGRISGRISGIRHPPDIRYPVFKMAGYPAKLLSGPSLIRTSNYLKIKWIKITTTYFINLTSN